MPPRVKKYIFILTYAQHNFPIEIHFQSIGDNWQGASWNNGEPFVAKNEKEVIKIIKNKYKLINNIDIYLLKTHKEWKAK